MKLATLFLLCTLGWAQDTPAVQVDVPYSCRAVGPSEKAIPTWRVPFGILYVFLGMTFVVFSRDRITTVCGFLCATLGIAFVLTGYIVCHPLKVEAKPSPESKVMPNANRQSSRTTAVTGGRRSGQRAEEVPTMLIGGHGSHITIDGGRGRTICLGFTARYCDEVYALSFGPTANGLFNCLTIRAAARTGQLIRFPQASVVVSCPPFSHLYDYDVPVELAKLPDRLP